MRIRILLIIIFILGFWMESSAQSINVYDLKKGIVVDTLKRYDRVFFQEHAKRGFAGILNKVGGDFVNVDEQFIKINQLKSIGKWKKGTTTKLTAITLLQAISIGYFSLVPSNPPFVRLSGLLLAGGLEFLSYRIKKRNKIYKLKKRYKLQRE